MFSKIEILIIIVALLITFYLVISLCAKKWGEKSVSPEISNYLFGVRILITIIALVSLILWFFM
jgi:hypothetical protein